MTNLLPNGYKAQVVAYSRLAVIRYYAAFLEARDELLAQAAALSDYDKVMDDEVLGGLNWSSQHGRFPRSRALRPVPPPGFSTQGFFEDAR